MLTVDSGQKLEKQTMDAMGMLADRWSSMEGITNYQGSEKLHTSGNLKLSNLNSHLMCVLCGGYYIDATTIIECLHSFCRSCIVKHLESSKYCPICEVQVHKTKPLTNIRPDKTLQDIVYKLVPELFANEMRDRRKFYRERPHYVKPLDSESVGEVSDTYRLGVVSDSISIALRYMDDTTKGEARYMCCPSAVSIYHLAKLLRAKYGLCETSHHVELCHHDRVLHHQLTLSQVACISRLQCRETLDLTYRIWENLAKRPKMNDKQAEEKPQIVEVRATEEKKEKEENIATVEKKLEPEVTKKEEELIVEEKKEEEVEKKKNGETEGKKLEGGGEKEVQLQISEAGVMSVSQVKDGEGVRTVTVEDKPRTKKYKTIRHSPKTWHPAIPKEKLRPTLIKPDEPSRPPKFFKVRNAPPRPVVAPNPSLTPPKAFTPEHSGDKILKIDPKTLRPIEKSPQPSNLLTNPFIPNNNHFLFSDPLLLPPSPEKLNGVRCPPNPYVGPRLSPFNSYPGYHSAGFHASLPPSISLLFNPHQHFKTHAFSTNNCDTNLKKQGGGSARVKVQGNVKEEPSASVSASVTASAPVIVPQSSATSTASAANTSSASSTPVACVSPLVPGNTNSSITTLSQPESSVQCK